MGRRAGNLLAAPGPTDWAYTRGSGTDPPGQPEHLALPPHLCAAGGAVGWGGGGGGVIARGRPRQGADGRGRDDAHLARAEGAAGGPVLDVGRISGTASSRMLPIREVEP